MIAVPKKCNDPQQQFLDMVPLIERQASQAFRGMAGSDREEFLAEVVANAFVAFQRLVERGKEDLAYATPLALYAIRQIHDGRRVGMKLNVRDVSSQHCQRRKGVKVQPLCRWNDQEQRWQEMVVEDKHSTPAEIAAIRIDFGEWLNLIGPKQRSVANTLASGETTKAAARKHRVSAARISQLRRALKESWEQFQGLAAV